MQFDEMDEAMRDARNTLNNADHVVAGMAEVIAGRLEKGRVTRLALCRLKEELTRYNRQTGRWRPAK